MFGPLPRIHRVVLVVVSLAFFTLAGAWVFDRSATLVTTWGPWVGLVAGTVVAYLLVHDFHRGRRMQARRIRH